MLKVEIATSLVDTKSGISPKTGKPYAIREQEGWCFFYGRDGKPLPHPQRIRLTLDDQQPPYELGSYQLDPASLYPGKFGQIMVAARLRPLVAAAQPKAA